MQAAEEDCAGLAPDSEFVATGKIAAEPAPHTPTPITQPLLPITITYYPTSYYPASVGAPTLRQEPCRHMSFRLSPEEELGQARRRADLAVLE